MIRIILFIGLWVTTAGSRAQESGDLFSCDSIPKAFTPNQVGKQDRFMLLPAFVAGILPDSIHFRVFNRYGQLVGESRDPSYAWDGSDTKGKTLPAGIYPYFIRVLFREREPVECKGVISLLR